MNTPVLTNLQFCRTCMKIASESDKFLDMNVSSSEQITYSVKLTSCIPDLTLNDAESSYLCDDCTKKLDSAYAFRCMCLETEKKLRRTKLYSNYLQITQLLKEELASELCDNYDNLNSLINEQLITLNNFHDNKETGSNNSKKDSNNKNDVSELRRTSRKRSVNNSQDTLLINSVDELVNSITKDDSKKLESYKKIKLSSNLGSPTSSSSLISLCSSSGLSTSTKTYCKSRNDTDLINKACKSNQCSPDSLKCFVVVAPCDKAENEVLDNFCCEKCGKTFRSQTLMDVHRVTHSDAAKPFKCKFCLKPFFLKSTLNKHIKTSCENKNKSKSTQLIGKTKTGNSSTDKTSNKKKKKPTSVTKKAHSSRKKPIVTNKKTNVQNSLSIDKTNEGSKLSAVKRKRKIGRRKRLLPFKSKSIKKVLNCHLCQNTFTRSDKLNLHIKRHFNDKSYKCFICGRGFYENWLLQKHLRIRHPGAENKPENYIDYNESSSKVDESNYDDQINLGYSSYGGIWNGAQLEALNSIIENKPDNLNTTVSEIQLAVVVPATNDLETVISTNTDEITDDLKIKLELQVDKESSEHKISMQKLLYGIIEDSLQTNEDTQNPTWDSTVDVLNANDASLNNIHSSNESKPLYNTCIQDGMDSIWNAADDPLNFNNADLTNTPIMSEIEQSNSRSCETPATTTSTGSWSSVTEDLQAESKELNKTTADNDLLVVQREEFQCTVCVLQFKKQSELQIHLQSHSQIKPKYDCNVCKSSFENWSTLKRHSRIHSDEKPFTCPHCGKGFKRKDNCKSHIMLVHRKNTPDVIDTNEIVNSTIDVSNEQIFKCEICKASYLGRSALIDHMGIHVKAK